MTRIEAKANAARFIPQVRSSADPAATARTAVMPLEDPSLFSPPEILAVSSFLYLMKRCTTPADGPFVADALTVLILGLEPGRPGIVATSPE